MFFFLDEKLFLRPLRRVSGQKKSYRLRNIFNCVLLQQRLLTAGLIYTDFDGDSEAQKYTIWSNHFCKLILILMYIFFHEIFLQFLKYVMYFLMILEIKFMKMILLLQKEIYKFYPLLNTRNEISTAIEDSIVAYSFLLVPFFLSFFFRIELESRHQGIYIL